MADFDVQKLAEEAARAAYNDEARYFMRIEGIPSVKWDDLDDEDRAVWVSEQTAALAVIVPAVTEQIRALHASNGFGDCRECDADYRCPTVRLLDELDAAARAAS